MSKLIAKYKARPSFAHALRLVSHQHKHPMSLCTLTSDELGILAEAARIVRAAAARG